MADNNFPKHKLIVPTLCARLYTQVCFRVVIPAWTAFCSCKICIPHIPVGYAGGRATQSVTAIKLSLVGAGRARDDGAITL